VSRYETTFILDPGMDEGKVNEEIEKVSGWIKDLGGEIVEVQRWGKRRLAYEINRKRDGIYTLMLYDGGGDLVKEVERRMRLNEDVLRVLSVIHVPPDPVQSSDGDEDAEDGDFEGREVKSSAAATATESAPAGAPSEAAKE